MTIDAETKHITLESLKRLEEAGGIVSTGRPSDDDWTVFDDDVPADLLEAWAAKIQAEEELQQAIRVHLKGEPDTRPVRKAESLGKKIFTVLVGIGLCAAALSGPSTEGDE